MIAEALDASVRAQARLFEDRANTIGASDVGQCARKIYYQKNEDDPAYGAPRNPGFVDGWGALQRGSVYEAHVWVPALRARYGARLLYAGEQQQTLRLGYLSATPDALLVDQPADVLAALGVPDIGGDHSIILEAKTVDPRARLDGPKLEHVYQVQVQLGLLHALTRHHPEYALISYTDASFFDLVYEFAIRRDPEVLATAQQRATKILTAVAADQLPPEGWIAGGRECELCPFSIAYGHDRARVPLQPTEPPDLQFVAEIVALARQAKQREAELETATAAFRTLQHEIKERLRTRGFRRVVGDGLSVIWSPVKGRPAFNDKAIREAAAKAGVDLAEYETVGEPTDRLVIRVTEQSRSAA
jgi:hypothetical protein